MPANNYNEAEYIAKIQEILNQTVADGVPGISASIRSTRGSWTVTAGVSDLKAQQAIAPTHIFGIGSITKVFVAVVILQLREQSRLRLSDTVSQLLDPEVYSGIENAGGASLAQLLSHEAGIDSFEDEPAWIHKARGDKFDPAHVWSRTESLEDIRRPRVTAPEPGKWYYSNTNYTLLGLVVEKLTGNTVEAEIRRRILEPLNLGHIFLEGFEGPGEGTVTGRYHWATSSFRETAGICPAFPEIANGLVDCSVSNLSPEWAAGGMISSPSDLTSVATAIRDGKILNAESLAIMQDWRPTTGPETEMGHGLFRMTHGQGHWLGHFGGVLGFGAAMLWSEEGDCAIAVLANVGTMHTGDVPASGGHVVLKTEFLDLAMGLTGSRG